MENKYILYKNMVNVAKKIFFAYIFITKREKNRIKKNILYIY